MSRKNAIQDKNCDRSERIVARNKKLNVFRGWKNVVNWMKMNRGRQKEINQAYYAARAKRMILKWRCRKDATMQARQRYEALNIKFNKIRKIMIFRGLAGNYDHTKAFTFKLKNVAHKYD